VRLPSDLDFTDPRLHAVNVGRPADHKWAGGIVRTAIWKRPITGRRHVGRLNVDGDEQADTRGHGGEHRAVMVYQLDSYAYWQQHFGRDDLEWGQFGENFTVTGMPDDSVRIGDRYRIGSALFEVTQPRVTCYRVGIRLGVPDMAALLVQHRRPGFYLRVLEEGEVGAGDEIRLESRPNPTLTVTGIDALLYLPDKSTDDLRTSVGIAALSEGWRSSLQQLLEDAEAPADPRVQFAWIGFAPLRVLNVIAETDDIRSVVLAAPEGKAGLPPVRAGQYLTIRIPGEDAAGLVRNYSLSSAPSAEHYRISVKRESLGLASLWLHTQLRAGMTVDAAIPRGEFTLDRGEAPVLLVSAGIGITPLLAMLADLADRQWSGSLTWVQVARTPAERPFTAETRALLARLPGVAHVFYTNPGHIALNETTDEASKETHHLGRPTLEELRNLGIAADSDAYICGPGPFMSSMNDILTALGLDPARVRCETFGASQLDQTLSPPHPPAGQPGTGSSVTFSRSGLTVTFDHRFPHLLELAEACDVPVHWSCRTGVCQSCKTSLVSGDVSYDPAPVEDPGAGHVLLCCAKASSDLILDA
jgi:ferredoxin-NADP reductase/MOSC domain-containing protein YiiM